MDYPNDRDVLETFECQYLIQNAYTSTKPFQTTGGRRLDVNSSSYRYKFSHVQLTTKALAASTKTVLSSPAFVRVGEELTWLTLSQVHPNGRRWTHLVPVHDTAIEDPGCRGNGWVCRVSGKSRCRRALDRR